MWIDAGVGAREYCANILMHDRRPPPTGDGFGMGILSGAWVGCGLGNLISRYVGRQTTFVCSPASVGADYF